MFWKLKVMAAFAVVILAIVFLSHADIQEFKQTFVKGKTVATSYQIKEGVSKLQCAEMCHKERMQGRCRIAGYNKGTRVCRLSMDCLYNVLDIADDSTGVFMDEHEPQGI